MPKKLVFCNGGGGEIQGVVHIMAAALDVGMFVAPDLEKNHISAPQTKF